MRLTAKDFALLVGWRDPLISGHEGVVESRKISVRAVSDRDAIVQAMLIAPSERRRSGLSPQAEIASLVVLTAEEEAEIEV